MTDLAILGERIKARSKKNELGCLEWGGALNFQGYGVIGNWPKSNLLTHRVIWMLHNGDIPKGMCICHTCDNPKCCEINHLFIGTPMDNCLDKIKKGRLKSGAHGVGKGEENPCSKLTTKQVLEIKKSNEFQKVIAKRYGITQQTVSDIKLGRRWRHLNEVSLIPN